MSRAHPFLSREVRGRQRLYQARLILDLDELQGLARTEGRAWVTLAEYARVRCPSASEASARRSVNRLRVDLARLRLRLHTEHDCGVVHLVHPPLLAFVAEHLRLARLADGASREELADEVAVLSPATLALEYGRDLRSLRWLARRYGVGRDRARKILAHNGVPIRATARLKIEQRAPRALVAEALAVYESRTSRDGLSGVALVARILGCSVATASRFLARHGWRRGSRGGTQ